MANLYDFELTDIDGNAMPLTEFEGNVVLVVNVASQCGLTPQYAALQKLYQANMDDGLYVLGIPCNQFAGQEPGTEAEIKSFCDTNYHVTFPMASKVDVNGPKRHALYRWLAGPGAKFPGDIQWNFEKFLINRSGEVVARFSPQTAPDSEEVKKALYAVL